MNWKGAASWPNAVSLLVCLSFLAANLGYKPAADLWRDGAAAIGVFLGLGVGMRPTWRTARYWADRKYGQGSRPDVGVADGEEP